MPVEPLDLENFFLFMGTFIEKYLSIQKETTKAFSKRCIYDVFYLQVMSVMLFSATH